MGQNTNLHLLEEKVKDEMSFLSFADALLQDLLDEREKEKENPNSPYGRGANGWQNTDLAAFLEAAIAWAKVHPMFTEEANPWQKFAVFLHAGKSYE